MTEKLLITLVAVGLPTLVGLICRVAMKYDIVFRIWPPSIKLEKTWI